VEHRKNIYIYLSLSTFVNVISSPAELDGCQFLMRFPHSYKNHAGFFTAKIPKIFENEICSFCFFRNSIQLFLSFTRLENLAPTPSANPHRARRGAGALFLPPQIELD
jgi:hypothetical protein